MHNKQDFETGGSHYERPLLEKKKKRAWRRNPMRRTFRFTGQIRNFLQPVQVSPKSKRDLHGIAGMWLTSTSLTTDKTEKDRLSLPMGIAKDRNGPLTGRRPGSTKSVILTPCGNEMGDAQGVAKKRRATRQKKKKKKKERDRYCKSLYWKQKVHNLNYSRMQNARPCVQV